MKEVKLTTLHKANIQLEKLRYQKQIIVDTQFIDLKIRKIKKPAVDLNNGVRTFCY